MRDEKWECWEFHGRGDPFFGGTADDRVLYLIDGVPKFVRGCDLPRDPVKATFPSFAEAMAAGQQASTRNGLISPSRSAP